MIPSIHPSSRTEILEETHKAFAALTQFASETSEQAFFHKPPEKWSAAENLQHLILSTQPVIRALKLPKITLRTFGKPNRPCRTYPELVKRYLERLEGVEVAAPSAFLPKDTLKTDKDSLIKTWTELEGKLCHQIEKWSEDKLNKYLLPHPLLGKLLVREVLFFTVYHTYHHLRIMEGRVKDAGMM